MGTFNQDLIKNQEEFFGPLYDYIIDDEITDVDWNGGELWLTYIGGKREKIVQNSITPAFAEKFSLRTADLLKIIFDCSYPVMHADMNRFCISFIHNSITPPGIENCFFIRKFPK